MNSLCKTPYLQIYYLTNQTDLRTPFVCKLGEELDFIERKFFPLFSHFLKCDPYSRKPNPLTICTPPQFLAIHSSRSDSCVNTVGDSPCPSKKRPHSSHCRENSVSQIRSPSRFQESEVYFRIRAKAKLDGLRRWRQYYS